MIVAQDKKLINKFNLYNMTQYFNKTRTVEDKTTQRELLAEMKKNNTLLEQILTQLKQTK